MASVWGGDSPSVAWGDNSWESNTVTISVTGQSLTTSLGTVTPVNEIGWGSDTWGTENWGESALDLTLTGLDLTASLGTLAYAQSIEGWGRDEWGIGNWGQNTTTVEITGLDAITTSLGPVGWGANSFGNGQWGGEFTFKPESIIVPTGVSTTSSVGSPTVTFDMIFGISGLDAIGSGLGTLSVNNGADHSQGLGSLAVTASVGSLDHTMTYDISGVSTTGSVGSLTVASVELIDITGVSTTASVGSISPTEMAVGLTGVSTSSFNVGSISPIEMTMGLTGLSTTASVADMTTASGGGIIAYANIDTGSNISYSNISTGSNTSYSDVA